MLQIQAPRLLPREEVVKNLQHTTDCNRRPKMYTRNRRENGEEENAILGMCLGTVQTSLGKWILLAERSLKGFTGPNWEKCSIFSFECYGTGIWQLFLGQPCFHR